MIIESSIYFDSFKRDCGHIYGIFSVIVAMVHGSKHATRLSTHIDLLLRQEKAYKHSKDKGMIFD